MSATIPPSFRTRVAAVAGAGLLGVLAACTTSTAPPAASTVSSAETATQGVPTPSAADILEKARANAVSATSAAFTGRIDQGGTELVIDFKGTSDGSSADVTLQVQDKGKVRVISAAEQVYLQGDAQFWKSQGLPSPPAADKFVKAPVAADELTQQLSLNSFLDEAFNAVTPSQLSDAVGSESVGGVDAWVLTDAKGRAEGALYVSKAKFEIVRFTGSSTSPAELNFSRWNEDLGIKAPPSDQVAALG
ncbi:hypothetical protein [Intrasporangium sp.]|jgi:hypothetical protein|uniref:hypothetical protein n=1 Tax=Intrasporangium sp. TaxID=1925024 RepID=UPI0033653492